MKTQKEGHWVVAQDGKRIAFDLYTSALPEVVILAHGFFNNKDAYLFKSMAEQLSEKYDVLSFDFRGHGKSEGLFSWTTKEAYDLKAIIAFAQRQGYEKIGLMGFSLGAAVSLLVCSQRQDVDSLIAISSPYDFWKIDYRFWEREMMRDLLLNMGPKGKGKGIRPGSPFSKKTRPIDIVDRVSPTPVFFIHGQNDWLIKPEHSQKLFKKAREPKKIIIMPGAGHAERMFDAFPEEFLGLCLEWFEKTFLS